VNGPAEHTLCWGGGELRLCPERAAFWPAERVLFIADFHLGKAHSFRRLGVPVPGGTTAANLARLGQLVDRLAACEIVFLGDFLHSRIARSGPAIAAFAAWREVRVGLRLTLVRGNHDVRAGDPPAEFGIDVLDEPATRGPWQLRHHPVSLAGQAVLAGHLHPGATLGVGSFDRLRLPAFHLQSGVLVLPAFGEFTGLQSVVREFGDQCFVTDGERVRQLP
jgi:uncharacterized protein